MNVLTKAIKDIIFPKNDLNSTAKIIQTDITDPLYIPEPTKSLLWTTNESIDKIEFAGTISITFIINDSGVESFDNINNNFYTEPSLIWTRLPIKPNNNLVKEAMYWPSYSKFYPETRYQYLNWLKDITKETNLSFVFLYFYGLERHLLMGSYDDAVDEILRLIKYHPSQSFKNYAIKSLVIASLFKNRIDILQKAPFILEEELNETLALRIINKTQVTPEDIINMSNKVGFTNKRYIKLQNDLFKQKLSQLIKEFESNNGKIFSLFSLKDFKRIEVSAFANLSINSRVLIPDVYGNDKFKNLIRQLLLNAHQKVKEDLHKK